MKKYLLLTFMIFFALQMTAAMTAQDKHDDEELEGRHYFANFSLYYPVSVNKSKHDRVNLNFSLVYGRVGYLSGFDLSLIASGITHEMEGVQICGLGAFVGERGTGVQISGLMNASGDSFKGGQISGLMNVAGEQLEGLQISGLMNVSGERFSGFQAAGLMNVAGERGRGLQFSGLANVSGNSFRWSQVSGGFNVIGERGWGFQAAGLFNVVGEDFDGIQSAGIFNVVGDDFKGLQIGSFNFARRSHGVQIGVFNGAERSGGLQIGVVNYTKKENTGVPIGLVNLARNGEIHETFWGSTLVGVNAGLKFIVDRYYSIISLGGFNIDDKIAPSVAYGFHYGLIFPLKGLNLNIDAGTILRDNKPLFRHPGHRPDQYILELRAMLEIPLQERISALIGGGAGYVFDFSRPFDSGKMMPLLCAGIEIH